MNNLSVQISGLGAVSAPLQIVLFLTLLTFIPAALVMMTSFTRIAIVFHFLRQALGTQEMPSNQILVGLTLFLTIFVMAPTIKQVNDVAARRHGVHGYVEFVHYAEAVYNAATGAQGEDEGAHRAAEH